MINFRKIHEVKELLIKNSIRISNKLLNKTVSNYSFYYFDTKLEFDDNEKIEQRIKKSKVIIIGSYNEENSKTNDLFFIISFKKTIICIKKSLLPLLQSYFYCNDDLNIYFIPETKDNFDQNIKIQYKQMHSDDNFEEEISNFNQNFNLIGTSDYQINKIWMIIQTFISGYLIKQSYSKLNKNRISSFYLNKNNNNDSTTINEIKDGEYFEIRKIGSGSSCNANLIYHIEKEEILVLKQYYSKNEEKLMKREKENYSIIKHEYLPKFYGTTESDNFIVIEFIDGQSLFDIKSLYLNEKEKFTIIYQILSVFNYLHDQHFVYRDLKPNNVMIDPNKTVVLIDFDRMIKENNGGDYTKDLSSPFLAPEISTGYSTTKSDIYSIGQMIYYIINESYPNDESTNNLIDNYPDLKIIYDSCTDEKIEKRPSIYELIQLFSKFIIKKNIVLENISPDDIYQLAVISESEKNANELIQYLSLLSDQNNSEAQFYLGNIYFIDDYVPHDINKSIHYLKLAADQNNINAQLSLGSIYYKGTYVARNINKSIHYYTLAADQNNINAQLSLGNIYFGGKYVAHDIYKSIYYYTLAANQNNSFAQMALGIIYFSGTYVERDINKSIFYLTISANQNNSEAQFILGQIYYGGKFIERDINKSICYLKQAANHNNVDAQEYLGLIYLKGNYVPHDINESIYYFTLAANQNDSNAQFTLGLIYYEGKYIKRNINKAIKFFTLAANQNNSDAQLSLGFIYYDGKNCKRNINKSIFYLTLAANQNNSDAQFALGTIYFFNEYIPRNMDKSKYYLTLAANQNNSSAQLYLGNIYLMEFYIDKNIYKGIDYIMQAAQNNEIEAYFTIGYLYHEGKYLDRDMKKAIHFYKEASSFNINYAKNNLGILYKNGFFDEIPKSLDYAEVLFNEAINQKNDPVSMYNLAHMYLYESINNMNDNIIKLLLDSLMLYFYPALDLLCIALVKKHGNNIFDITDELVNYSDSYGEIICQIITYIQRYKFIDHAIFEQKYEIFKDIDFLYDFYLTHFQSDLILNPKNSRKNDKINDELNINSEFYEGLGDI